MANDDLKRIITAALAEDIGSGDITSQLLIPGQTQAEIQFVAREDMVACGTSVPAEVYAQLDKHVKVSAGTEEGKKVKAGTALAKVTGPAQALLTGERVVLNLMQRMCGVATLTRAYVDAVAGTKTIILDTRKTMPGMRMVDKYAVKTGGGQNHRMGLWDAVLIKDNHIALSNGVRAAVQKAKAGARNIKIIVECDTLSQVEEALAAGPDRILLDNMDTATLRKAVALSAGKIPLEASGGISLDNIRAIAETGVDYISVGRLTHSAPGLDIGADIVFR
jgi:nicotinate-nucleotide pyrophosphorylase (carboxylating)